MAWTKRRMRIYCTFTAPICKCLIMSGAGEGNRTLVTILKTHLIDKRNPPLGRFPSPASRYAAIFLSFRSSVQTDVASRALPFAHFLKPSICSAINFESGT
jgi:hypothetical protein